MNLLDVFCTISIDRRGFDDGIDSASKKAADFGEKLKNGMIAASKAATVAIGAASTAVGVFSKMSLEGYGSFEQLVGGVETLFKDSADIVRGYADGAYKTAGLSANQYMETVTSFSASLLQSLGGDTEAAAQVADQAITDMADNANKMGTAIDSIQNAYQGFAKQNFTMLDNLKLGYGGTKEEMKRLLSDAEKLSRQKFDLSSYADIVEAIHVVQTEMGITGTTAKEAATTIEGSVASAKSAWKNLVVGIADENADLDTLIGNFVDSVTTAGDNIIPRFEQILTGMGTAIQKLAPIITEQIPPLVTAVLPPMISAGGELLTGLLTGIISALPGLAGAAPQIVGEIGTSLSDNLPAIRDAGGQLLDMLVNGVSGNLPVLVPAAVWAVVEFADAITDPGNLGKLADGAIAILNGLANGIINSLDILFGKGPKIVQNLVDAVIENAPKMWDAAMAIIDELGNKLSEEMPGLAAVFENLEAVVVAVTAAFAAYKAVTLALTTATNLQNAAQAALNAVMNANPFVMVATLIAGVAAALVTLYHTNEDFRNEVNSAWESVKGTISAAVGEFVTFFTETVPDAIQNMIDWFASIPQKAKDEMDKLKNNLSDAWDGIISIFTNAWTAVTNAWSGAKDWFKNKWSDIKNVFSDTLSYFRNVGKNLIEGIWNGIADKVNWLKSKVAGVVDTIKGWFTGSEGFDEHSPSKWSRGVAAYVMDGLANGFEGGERSVLSAVDGIVGGVMDRFDEMENIHARIGGVELGSIDGRTASVSFSDSAVGMSSAATINGISSMAANSGSGNPMVVNLMLPDGNQFASYYLPSFIDVAKSEGTPILNPT